MPQVCSRPSVPSSWLQQELSNSVQTWIHLFHILLYPLQLLCLRRRTTMNQNQIRLTEGFLCVEYLLFLSLH